MNIDGNYIDLIIILIIILVSVTSYFRGFIHEGLSLISWIISIWFTSSKLPIARQILEHEYNVSEQLKIPLAIAGLMILALIVLAFLTAIIRGLIYYLGFASSDKFIGFISGIIKSALIISFLITVLNFYGINQHLEFRNSRLIPLFSPIVKYMEHEITLLTKRLNLTY